MPRGGRGWFSGSGGGGEREPRAFGEPKGEVEKGWVNGRDRMAPDPLRASEGPGSEVTGAEGFEPSTAGLGTRCPIQTRLRALKLGFPGRGYHGFDAATTGSEGNSRSYRWSTWATNPGGRFLQDLDPFEVFAQGRKDGATRARRVGAGDSRPRGH